MPKGVATFRLGDWRSCAILAVPAIQNITQIVRIVPYSLQNSVVFSMETGGCAAKSLHRRYGKIHYRQGPILCELGALARNLFLAVLVGDRAEESLAKAQRTQRKQQGEQIAVSRVASSKNPCLPRMFRPTPNALSNHDHPLRSHSQSILRTTRDQTGYLERLVWLGKNGAVNRSINGKL
jgi:hypothetical protein